MVITRTAQLPIFLLEYQAIGTIVPRMIAQRHSICSFLQLLKMLAPMAGGDDGTPSHDHRIDSGRVSPR